MKLKRVRGADSSADDPNIATEKIRGDEFLRQMYSGSITALVQSLGPEAAAPGATLLEIGAAGGITKDLFPAIETTDVRMAEGVDRVVDGEDLPYADSSVDGLIAKDALHHIPDPDAHFAEVIRILKPGARAAYLEPNWNALSRLVFRHFHPEPFEADVIGWARESADPMDSNQALAYIVFERDLATFTSAYPELRLVRSVPCNGLSFLLSGGVHSRTPVPAGFLRKLRSREEERPGLFRHTGLNRLIVLEKQPANP